MKLYSAMKKNQTLKDDVAIIKMRNKTIVKWLKTHPLLKRKGLCKIAGYDSSNLSKVLNGKINLTTKHLGFFEKELSKYGFVAFSATVND